MKEAIRIKVPGRICLFGDHQDYLGLPVIACAIDRRLELTASENDQDHFQISLPDIGEERKIMLTEEFKELNENDLFGSAIRVIRRKGMTINKGYDISISSTIPINAGISSSSALIVAWIQFLLKVFGKEEDLTREMIAQISYEAEVLEHNSPGGKMDQITIAFGGIVFIETDKELTFKSLNGDLGFMILGESGIPKDTSGMLSKIKTNTQESFNIIGNIDQDFIPSEVTCSEIPGYMKLLPDNLKPYFSAAIKNHWITQKAKEEFDKEHTDIAQLGSFMTAHHQVLKNDLQVTVPKIDSLIDAALKAGAYGAKIVGSGGGGCIVALANHHNKKAIIDALMDCSAKNAYSVSISDGITLEDHA